MLGMQVDVLSNRYQLCRTREILDDTGPKLGEIGPAPAQIGPTLTRSCPKSAKIGGNPPDLGGAGYSEQFRLVRINFGQTSPDLAGNPRSWAELGQIRINICQHWQGLAGHNRDWAEFDRIWAYRPISVRPHFLGIVRASADVGQKLVDIGKFGPGLGRAWVDVGRLWPELRSWPGICQCMTHVVQLRAFSAH